MAPRYRKPAEGGSRIMARRTNPIFSGSGARRKTPNTRASRLGTAGAADCALSFGRISLPRTPRPLYSALPAVRVSTRPDTPGDVTPLYFHFPLGTGPSLLPHDGPPRAGGVKSDLPGRPIKLAARWFFASGKTGVTPGGRDRFRPGAEFRNRQPAEFPAFPPGPGRPRPAATPPAAARAADR